MQTTTTRKNKYMSKESNVNQRIKEKIRLEN